MRRRTFLLAAVGSLTTIAGCTESSENGNSNKNSGGGLGESIDDKVIEASEDEIIVSIDDLEAGWNTAQTEEKGKETFFNDDLTVVINVDKYQDIDSAKEGYNQLKKEKTDGTASDDVDYGNEGFFVNPFEGLVIIGFRGANFVIKIQTSTAEGATSDPEKASRDMAQIMVENMVEIQNN